MKEKVKTVYLEKGGCDFVREGWAVSLDFIGAEEMRLFDMVDYLNRPAEPSFVAGQIARLRITMPRRDEENTDIEMLVDTLVEDCREYPADILNEVCVQWRREQRFFPTPRELRKKLEDAVALRRSLKAAFERSRNPLLASQAGLVIAADPRLGVHLKQLPKAEWLPQHFDWAIEEVLNMVELARQNPTMLSVETWEGELAKLEKDKADALHICPVERNLGDGVVPL